jgi:hypothetical protein
VDNPWLDGLGWQIVVGNDSESAKVIWGMLGWDVAVVDETEDQMGRSKNPGQHFVGMFDIRLVSADVGHMAVDVGEDIPSLMRRGMQ